MSVSKEEIIDLALRYVTQDEITDFPVHNDLFCLLMREVPANKPLKEEEGWVFGGYGVCDHYAYDEEAKPRGKWLWMHFSSLASFPPIPQVLKLQPPHVVKGRFHSADRSHEIKLLKVVTDTPASVPSNTAAEKSEAIQPNGSKKGNRFKNR